ncbi:desmosome associated protein-like protein pinnin isoform X2 [Lycorma delicatula]|uniref:desmosome associated protein-like protein pinnin isoform X2 n=1 Tax=Lycorma delicatula TaxID=130591 RepID=UPI003F512887
MESTIMKVYGSLQAELEKAKEDLKGVEENIKKIIGRDPNEGPPRLSLKRPLNVADEDFARNNDNSAWKSNQAEGEFGGNIRGFSSRGRQEDIRGRGEEDRLSVKKRLGDPKAVFSRLSRPVRNRRDDNSGDEDTSTNKPALSSQVIAFPPQLPSRQEVLAAQGTDEHSKARNRRMFGSLLGTLQKFRQEETRLKDREDKKAQVEKKLEEAAKREKEELKRERQELFQNRKRRQAEIRNIELKMARIQEQEEWEKTHRHLLNFIQTRSKPHLFYLPKVHNQKTEERLASSQKAVTKMIEKKRKEVQAEVAAILKRGMGQKSSNISTDNHMDVDEDGEEGDGDVDPDSAAVGDKENVAVLPDVENIKLEKVEKSEKILTDLYSFEYIIYKW